MTVRTRTPRIVSPVIFAALAVAATAILAAPWLPGLAARAIPSPRAAATSSSVLVADKGKLRIMVNGQVAGKEDFEIGPSGGEWIARGSTDAPIAYEWSTVGAKKASANITFQNLTATIDLHLDGAKPYTHQFTFPGPRVAVLDNNMYHQYAVVAHLYDWQKKGPQTVSVLVPQSMTPGSVTLEPIAAPSAGNSSQQALSVKTEDLEVDVFLGAGKLQRIAVPSANAEIVRE